MGRTEERDLGGGSRGGLCAVDVLKRGSVIKSLSSQHDGGELTIWISGEEHSRKRERPAQRPQEPLLAGALEAA